MDFKALTSECFCILKAGKDGKTLNPARLGYVAHSSIPFIVLCCKATAIATPILSDVGGQCMECFDNSIDLAYVNL